MNAVWNTAYMRRFPPNRNKLCAVNGSG